MGSDENNINASIAHIVLCCVAGRGVSKLHGKSFTHPGMHANFFIHGVLGFLHFQSKILDNDLNAAYQISLKATRYLALPCLNADLRRSDKTLSTLHLLSGVIPFALSLAGEDNIPLGNLMIACNIISLCHYSFETNREWGWYTAAASVVAYFLSPQIDKKIFYPLTLALMEYCAYRIFCIHYQPPPPPGR
ncbi:hypothetical protein HW555_011961 [Spodoptera exigua]|uniref:Uncharacterized protein n=1 Tax=Spodoptera exigua TaxID=7107 RepID=A0A835L031_SPOEX|nr:hypothetical protein HW555_011961 [Spodoptera exigua]KAH9629913.1 hypothetical protein HF086_008204 [Spodoptera exigua]